MNCYLDNKIGDAGAKSIAAALEKNQTVAYVDLASTLSAYY